MLDHEPDTSNIDNPGSSPATASTSTDPASTEAAPPRRRRRAATRKAGPPSVSAPAMTAEAAPVVSAEAIHAGADPVATEVEAAASAAAAGPTESAPTESAQAEAAQAAHAEGKLAEEKPAAKKTTRKRAAKAPAEGSSTTRTPRKRATKKATATASAPTQPAAAEPAASEPTGDAGQQNVDAAAALDEIRLALVAEQPAAAMVEETASAPADDAKPEPTVGSPAADATTEVSSATDVAPTSEVGEITQPIESDEAAEAEEEAAPAEQAETDLAGADQAGPGEITTDESESSETDESQIGESQIGEAETSATAESATTESDEDEDGTPRRRRRRRGGRRRRRGPDAENDNRRDDAEQDGDTSAPESDAANSPAAPTPAANDAEDGASSGDTADAESGSDESSEDGGQRRRRRRRRRRGEDNAPAADDPVDVVVRVREPRSRKQAAQEVSGIEGSTRMEAKRQRRREGREAGRRRVPILSEAEFLARRESVVRKMIIRQREELSQIAVLEDDILVEHYVDRESAASLIGNVYLGRVQNVLPSMEAAFIDIGRGRNAVLYAGEIDWDSFGANGQQRKVENVLKSGQTVLVQVTKDPVGAKGARLTSHVTLPGRYIVYAPGGHLSGISRKLPDTERRRLKAILNELVPNEASVIVRTAAEGASEDELVRDVNRLKAQWEDIERKVKAGGAPKLLYGEPDLTVRIVRDLFTEDFAELIIQGNGSMTDAYDAVDAYVGHVAPHLHDRMRRWDTAAEGDLFASYRLDEQIAKALERKVFLPSGGSLIIDRTEAMTVIDVNTGKFTGSGGNLEATVTSNNLEAAEEIVRQLRLRDIGGIIVIDFIDMVLPSNRELLLRRLVECLGRDRTRHQVAEVTSLGLVQMTRKKIGTGLLEAFSVECEHCHGRGYEVSDVPVETQKQPDGGSRDQRGRGRGRGNSSNSSSNGSARPPFPMPAPPLNRPEPVPVVAVSEPAEAGSEPVEAATADSAVGQDVVTTD